MKHTDTILLILVLAPFFQGCNNDPVIDVPDPPDRIVIDGWIESGRQARVFLTANAPFFSDIDSASLRDLVLTRARVTMSDGVDSEYLILRRDENYFPPYYYEGNLLVGQSGGTYTLTAEYGGKTATASTTIPAPVGIDTAYFVPDQSGDSLGSIYLEFTDPPDQKNYYRIFARRIGKDGRFFGSRIMALDDVHFSGEAVGFYLYEVLASALDEGANEPFRLGDTVIVKLCTMDRAQFEFWTSFQEEVMNAGNPFASSLSVLKSNVEGEGLGVWSGYGTSFDTVFAAVE